jgi:hypothetical protein
MNRSLLAIVLAAVAGGAACAGVKTPQIRNAPPPPGASMWVEPADIASRDLFYGPWGAEHAPDPKGVYRLVERKHSGVNLGMTVKDEQGREWSVKQPFPGNLDSEAPVEVVVSRLLSAIGYRQPAVYYLPSFVLKDDFGTRIETGGRFRLKLDSLKEARMWDWADNPFVGTKEYQGLIVLLTMFNSTDLKNSNNSLYEYKDGDLVQQWYVARDVGSAFGDTDRFTPRKNHVATFERTPYIVGVSNGWVQFAYSGWYKNLVADRITPQDVAWASNLLGRLSDRQLADAFRAGGYDPATAARFIAAIKARIQQGRSLALAAARDDRN